MAQVKFNYIVERVDNWGQLQRKLDEYGPQGWRLHTLERTGTKSYQVILERVETYG